MALLGLKNLFLSPEEIMGNNPYMNSLQENNPEAYQAMMESMDYKNISAIINLFLPIISLTGVIYMWKLKKAGFYLYLLGELLPYLTIFLTHGLAAMYAGTAVMGEKGAMIINVMIALVIIFDILFIILYALNLKHLK